MYVEITSEFVGTFFFILIILTVGQPIPIAAGLLAVLYAFGKVSKGHMNPAVSTAMFVKGDLSMTSYILYIVAQTMGGLCALAWWLFVNNKLII